MLVVVVLFLFLYDLRTATISSVAIPLSLLAAVVVLNALGATLNAMTLGGLAIAIGEVVDDAVIDVENICAAPAREPPPAPIRFPSARSSSTPRSRCAAPSSTRPSPSFSCSCRWCMLPGLAGRFFAPLGLAYVLAILASLAVAMT